MKLWWPHTEAMIAFLMGFAETRDPELLQLFDQVAKYAFAKVSFQAGHIENCGVFLSCGGKWIITGVLGCLPCKEKGPGLVLASSIEESHMAGVALATHHFSCPMKGACFNL